MCPHQQQHIMQVHPFLIRCFPKAALMSLTTSISRRKIKKITSLYNENITFRSLSFNMHIHRAGNTHSFHVVNTKNTWILNISLFCINQKPFTFDKLTRATKLRMGFLHFTLKLHHFFINRYRTGVVRFPITLRQNNNKMSEKISCICIHSHASSRRMAGELAETPTRTPENVSYGEQKSHPLISSFIRFIPDVYVICTSYHGIITSVSLDNTPRRMYSMVLRINSMLRAGRGGSSSTESARSDERAPDQYAAPRNMHGLSPTHVFPHHKETFSNSYTSL